MFLNHFDRLKTLNSIDNLSKNECKLLCNLIDSVALTLQYPPVSWSKIIGKHFVAV